MLIDLRRTDPTRAQWCLERLVPLYENLSKEHPAVLEHRLSLADTLNELALLRIDTLDTALRRSELDPVEAVRQTQQATAEAKRAVDVLDGIITQAKQDVERLRTTRPDVVERNEKLIRDLTPLLAIFKADQRSVEAANQRYLRLRVALGRIERQPDGRHAQSLAHLMVTAFDQPELIAAAVKAKLDTVWQERIDLACQPVDDLDATQARTMSRWYTNLAAGVRDDDDAIAAMLIRAHVYATAATEPDGPATVVDNLNEQLAALDWSPERMLEVGERIWNMERMFNTRAGLTAKDDNLPPRLVKEAAQTGPAKGLVNGLETMLPEYYELRGWTTEGVPTNETLSRLAL